MDGFGFSKSFKHFDLPNPLSLFGIYNVYVALEDDINTVNLLINLVVVPGLKLWNESRSASIGISYLRS